MNERDASDVTLKLAPVTGASALEREIAEPDAILDSLEREYAARHGRVGAAPAAMAPDDPRPVDVVVVKPIARSLKTLFDAANSEWKDVLGKNRVPILVRHGLTPFFAATTRPKPIWALGYQATIDSDAETIDFAPQTEMLDVGGVDQHLVLSLSSGGKLTTLPAGVSEAAPWAADVIPDVEISGSVSNHFEVTARVKLELLKVQAGPVGAGGVRWNLYRQDRSLVAFTPLLQTLLVSPETRSLTFTIVTWAKVGGIFGIGTRSWISKPQTFTIDVAAT